MAALRGLNTLALEVSAGTAGLGETILPVVSFTMRESLPCADASTGTIRIKQIANKEPKFHA